MKLTLNKYLRSWVLLLTIVLILQPSAFDQETHTHINAQNSFPGPQAYKDPASGIVIYVESDGRHIAAISPTGKLLWNRDPFADGHLAYYRTKDPKIVAIASTNHESRDQHSKCSKFIAIRYSSSQFGFVCLRTGDYEDGGED